MGLIESSPMGRLIVTNLLAFAEFERAMIIERTQGGKAIAKQRETWYNIFIYKVKHRTGKGTDLIHGQRSSQNAQLYQTRH